MTSLLNTRSHFSLGESLLSPEDIVEGAKAIGVKAVALTDTMRITSMADFVAAANKAGIKPIIGARLRIVDNLVQSKAEAKKNRPYYLRLIVRNEAGYKALTKLLSLAFDDTHFFEVPRLLLSDVCAFMGGAGADSCFLTLGDFYGACATGRGETVAAALKAASLAVYAEAIPLETPYYDRLSYEALVLRSKGLVDGVITALPWVYQDPAHADSLDLMRTICTPGLTFNHLAARHPTRSLSIKTRSELALAAIEQAKRLSSRYGLPARDVAVDLTHGIAVGESLCDHVTFAWVKAKPSLPKMAADEYAALAMMCMKGWRVRFATPIYGHKPTDLKPYRERLQYELSVLKKLHFESYFLMVAEVVEWAKNQGIRVGPGRGSAAGSLVAYLCGITDIDPIRFNLLFERFINPDRVDLPDADLDFMSSRREEVFDYIRARFGDEYVASVSNYTTIAGAGALKDVSSALSVVDVPAFGKWVEKEHGVSVTLDKALELSPELSKWSAAHPEVLKHAHILEDRMRSYGKHAAGVIIGGEKLTELCVVETRSRGKGFERIVAPDKTQAEDFGLVKLDVLGLSTLDMIDITIRQIFTQRSVKLNLHDIPIDDAKTLEAFGKGDTVGVFQFESSGIRKLLRDLATLEPLTFDDLAVANALYRPGPMDSGLLDDYVKIKKGERAISYPHSNMENALKNTKGIMVFQEGVMAVASDFAGFTLVESDHLRKVIGKKLIDKMPVFRSKFIAGAVKTSGVSEKFADDIFNQIEKFASYGFNASHAYAYSLLSYLSMYLKVNYSAEFYAGLLTMVKQERRPVIIAEMTRKAIKLLPPDINDSSEVFETLHANAVLAPLSSVKGVSDRTALAIMEDRAANGRFRSIADLEARIGGRLCNSAHREKLNKVGAFSRVEAEQMPADHPDRRRDQVELMPGLIDDAVMIDRDMVVDKFSLPRLATVVDEYRACDKCELTGLCHPKPAIKAKARFMIVMDGPNSKEEGIDVMGHGGHMDIIEDALGECGLSMSDVYMTALVKSPKPSKDGAKAWSNKTLGECPVWLNKEISELRPTLILALGSLSVTHLTGLKGQDHVGRVIYDKVRDCNVLIGFSPGTLHYRPEKTADFCDVIYKIPSLLR